MTEERPDQELERLDARLKEARGKVQAKDPGGGPEIQTPGSALGLAFRVGVELVSALAIGLGIGWLLDAWLDTRPWLMVVFIFLGGAAGILNVYRIARGFGYAVGYTKEKKPGNNDTGDHDTGDRGPGIEG